MALLLFFGMTAESHAADDVIVKPFSIAAGETKKIEVELIQEDKEYTALNFDIVLPEGFTITKNPRGRFNVTLNNEVVDDHQLTMGMIQTENHYRLIVACQSLYTFQKSGTLMTIEIHASDMINTGTYPCQMTKKNLVIDSNTSTLPEDTECDVECRIDAKVSALGYATFSWPRALDFTNTNVEAFIATEETEDLLMLTKVAYVPASTGIILKGSADTYHPQTTDMATDNVSGNLLSATDAATFKVEGNDIYVLSNKKEGKPGFYPAVSGLEIPKYKAYLQSSNEAKTLWFGESENATDISSKQTVDAATEVYDVMGRHVSNDASSFLNKTTSKHKGTYIIDRKKYNIK